MRTHKVLKGENLESISRRFLGKKSLWPTILAINPSVTERKLPIGTILQIPDRPTGGTARRVASGSKSYIFKKGDSPWAIAFREYGKARATEFAKRIMELNNITNAKDIDAGTVIQLPPR